MKTSLKLGLLVGLALTWLFSQPATAIEGGLPWPEMYGAKYLDWLDFGCDLTFSGAGQPPVPSSCSDCGMPRWWVNEPYISLQMSDTPLSYATSSGQTMAFQFRYRQRYCLPDTNSAPGCPLLNSTNTESYFRSLPGYGMTNAFWGNNWMENIFFWYGNGGDYQALQFSFEGGINYFYNTNGVANLKTPKSQIQLVPSSGLGYPTIGTPVPDANTNYWGDTQTNGLTLLYPDGSKDVYGICTSASPAATYGTGAAYALLTERIDAVGRTTRIGYEYATNNTHSGFRVRYVVDADGRTNTFSYTGAQNLWQITEIDDPYTRKIQLGYDGTTGYLTNITDAVQLTNTFSYQGDNGWITNLSTPYGNTGFTYDDESNATNSSMIYTRAILISEPEGAHQLFCYQNTTSDQNHDTAPTVPGQSDFDDGQWAYTGFYGGLDYRNSYHWGRRQFAALPASTQSILLTGTDGTLYLGGNYLAGGLSILTTQNYHLARQRHWLLANDLASVSDMLSSERDPSPDSAGNTLGLRTWYNYSGKPFPGLVGSSQVSCIAKTLPDGTTQFTTYNYYPAVTVGAGMVSDNETSYSLPDGSTGLLTNWFSYAANNVDLLSVSNSAGQFVNYLYNGYHQVTNTVDALNEPTTFTFDAATHNLTGIQLPSGATVTREYYATATPPTTNSGFLKRETFQPQGRSVTNNAYTNGLPISISDDRGLTVTLSWDGLNRPTGIGYPGNTTTSNLYYRLDLVGTKDRMDHWTRYAYDGLQHLTTMTNANTNVTIYTWCGCGSLESIVSLPWTNSPTSFGYDNQGNLTSITDPDTNTLTRQFDLAGRLTQLSDGAGRWLQFGHNIQGLVTGVTNANGTLQSTVFDAVNRPIQTTDANGVTVTNQFDLLNRLLKQTWPDGIGETNGYSSAGLIAFTNRDGKFTLYGRDAAGRLMAETNANHEVTRYARNSLDQVTDLWDGNNNHVQWQFNQYGWLTNKINGLGSNVFRYGYNANGWLTNRWTPEKLNTFYTLDNVGNRLAILYPQSSIVFAFDALNRLTNMIDAAGTNNFSYTPAGRLQSAGGLWQNDTVSYGYDQGILTNLSLAQPIGTWPQSFLYDLGSRLTNTASPAGAFIYSYNFQPASALFTGIQLLNGAKIINGYDSMARLTSTALNNYWGHTLDGYSYIPDPLGLRTNIVRNLGLTTNTVNTGFDSIGQLTSWSAMEPGGTLRQNEQLGWQYDPAHNLHTRNNGNLTQTFTTDAANQLSSISGLGKFTMSGATPAPTTNITVNGQAAQLYSDLTFARTNLTLADGPNSFTNIAVNAYGLKVTNALSVNFPQTVSLKYDQNGNLTNDGLKSFAYDAENQLTSVAVAGRFKKDFIYDGLNRLRIKRESTWTGTWTPTNETHYIWDGSVIVQLRTSNNVPILTLTRGLDLSGSLQGAGGIGGLLAMTDGGGTNYFYHSDGNGNVTALIDSQEIIVGRREYDGFGRTISLSGAKIGLNPFWFSTQLYDPDTDFYHFKYRVYSPNLQRWLNADPIGEEGGYNLYGFVYNNPVKWIDYLGREIAFTGDDKLKETARKLLTAAKGLANDALKKKIAEIEADKFKCKIKLVVDSTAVIVGSYKLETIDLGDIAKFPESGGAATRVSAFIHEIIEQWEKQKNGKPYEDAHAEGIKAEFAVTGNVREGEGTLANNPDGSFSIPIYWKHIIKSKVTKDGVEKTEEKTIDVTQTLTIFDGNIIKVETVEKK
jgi:RHS repeat-associated protein